MKLILLAFLLLACVKDKDQPPAFIGTWKADISVSGIQCRTTLEIYESGSFSMLGECLDGQTWKAGSNNIGSWTELGPDKIQFNYENCMEYQGGNLLNITCPGPEILTYSIAEGTLKLTDPGNITVTYTKG